MTSIGVGIFAPLCNVAAPIRSSQPNTAGTTPDLGDPVFINPRILLIAPSIIIFLASMVAVWGPMAASPPSSGSLALAVIVIPFVLSYHRRHAALGAHPAALGGVRAWPAALALHQADFPSRVGALLSLITDPPVGCLLTSYFSVTIPGREGAEIPEGKNWRVDLRHCFVPAPIQPCSSSST